MRSRLLLFVATLASAVATPARPVDAQASTPRCAPAQVGRTVETGWTLYRAGDHAKAERTFAGVLATCPRLVAALNGRAYAVLQQGRLREAADGFDAALAVAPADYDALTGRMLAANRLGDTLAVRRTAERLLRVAPRDSTALAMLRRLPPPSAAGPERPLTRKRRSDTLIVASRAGRRTLEIPDGRGGFRPFWIKGVNLGAALPGRHPSQFPDSIATYRRWLALIDELGANTIRVYTIHPPHFYAALAEWNAAHPSRPLWLLHGVWTEAPPGRWEHQYDDTAFVAEFRQEMRRVVDLLHGNAEFPARPGHPGGRYGADVSPWVLGYIVGREWEPYSAVHYVQEHLTRTTFAGRFLSLEHGNALEVWTAEQCDYLVAYEHDRYHVQRAMAYSNWPTLDPLHHPVEATLLQEDSIARARGEFREARSGEGVYDDDALALDATHLRAGSAFAAGVFASYHVYPYHPDFMVNDPAQHRVQGPEGPSGYYAYLAELVAHHGDMPLVVSEYGVPSSRGTAHRHPLGWDHGAVSEQRQAEIVPRLTREIHAAGAAGAVVFELIDEWFKRTWLTVDFELPFDRNRLWLNALDPEQHYGLVATRPGRPDRAITIDGAVDDWRGRRPLVEPTVPAGLPAHLQVRRLWADADAAYLFLRLDVGTIDWSRGRYVVGIDTYRPDLGDVTLPRTGGRSPAGLEFALDLTGPEGSYLLVDHPYAPTRPVPIQGASPPAVTWVYNPPFETVANAAGRWDTVTVEIHRRRFARDGRLLPAVTYDRNRLLFGNQRTNSLVDWAADPAAGVIEVRIPWGMLGVTDPSSHLVLFGHDRGLPKATRTDGFRFVVASYDPRDPSRSMQWPRVPGDGTVRFTWPGWDEAHWYEERKPVFGTMQAEFRRLP